MVSRAGRLRAPTELRLASALAAAALVIVGAAGATSAGGVGYPAQSYAGLGAEAAGGAVTGQKPESKLWYTDGSWWATMVSPAAGGAHDIYRLTSGSWVDTGVLVDSEAATKEDVLWDGLHLYVLTRTPSSVEPNRLRRFSYSGGAYQLDPDFPVAVPGGGAEAVTIAKDSTGTLWLTYTIKSSVAVAHSNGSDTSWSAAATLPFTEGQTLKGDDISTVIAFTDATGPAVGIAWDNENLQSDFFAVHRDGAPDTSWTLETTLSGSLQADDHMNLKTFDGRVYNVVKTATTTATEPLIRLLVRSPTGQWSQYPVALQSDNNTRPVVLLDTSTRQLYVFMSKGNNPGHGIYYKQTPLDSISFPATATPFIVGPNGQAINNATSTKQNVDATTGIVVVASDGSNYWWNAIGAGLTSNVDTPPSALALSATTTTGSALGITLHGSDAQTCELTFVIGQQPAHGTLTAPAGQPCTAGSPNTDTATVVYTPAAGFTGSDSFTYQVTDGSGQTAVATAAVTVADPTPPPPPAQMQVSPSSVKIVAGTIVAGDATSLAATDAGYLQVASSTGATPKSGWYALFGGLPASPTSLSITYVGGASAPCRQRIEIRNWTASSWDAIDDRTVSGDVTITVSVTGTLSDYVSGGQAKVQVSCGASAPFTARGDMLAFSVSS